MKLFPETERVIYKKNPLVEVVCQIKFAHLMEIDETLPIDFHKAIRNEYPFFETIDSVKISLAGAELENIQPESRINLRARIYNFLTIEKDWTVSLAGDFIALSTKNYTRWEIFQEKFHYIISVLSATYSPSVYTRIGLRYKDLIVKNELGLQKEKWNDLLQPHISGLFSDPLVSEKDVVDCNNQITIKLENGKVRIQYGLAQKKQTNEFAYLIDSDFFEEKQFDSKS